MASLLCPSSSSVIVGLNLILVFESRSIMVVCDSRSSCPRVGGPGSGRVSVVSVCVSGSCVRRELAGILVLMWLVVCSSGSWWARVDVAGSGVGNSGVSSREVSGGVRGSRLGIFAKLPGLRRKSCATRFASASARLRARALMEALERWPTR